MGLPSGGWLPVAANDDRFAVADSPLPQPILASYADYSMADLDSNIEPITLNTIAVGPENAVSGVIGRTGDFSKALRVTLSQQNVYGTLLVDTMLIPTHSSLDFRR